MVKVITYGTYDMLHYGHIRLLERAKELGDYLIVGVTADDFDMTRGKINVQQSLMERVEGVRATGLADEIIIEEYEGQKIDDIRRYDVDIFTVGSDWKGKFDYLKEYCQVVYLDRTKGISSTEIREKERFQKLGIIGESPELSKLVNESGYVNGISVEAIFSETPEKIPDNLREEYKTYNNINQFFDSIDAVYIRSVPSKHYEHIKMALEKGKHVLCESPMTIDVNQCKELYRLATEKKCILMEAIKTAYNTAFSRLILLAKDLRIGNIVSVDANCTSLRLPQNIDKDNVWNSICDWGPTAMLPIFELLGGNYKKKHIVTHIVNEEKRFDDFTKIDFVYENAVASIKVGIGVKTEGELVISGTKGYIYVPAPWWKTDYFEIRYENATENKRYFYQLDGEGIRYELVAFVRAINKGRVVKFISEEISEAIVSVLDDFYKNIDVMKI